MTTRASSIIRATPDYSEITVEAMKDYADCLRQVSIEFEDSAPYMRKSVAGINIGKLVHAIVNQRQKHIH